MDLANSSGLRIYTQGATRRNNQPYCDGEADRLHGHAGMCPALEGEARTA